MRLPARVAHGGNLLVDQLVAEGVERVFCVPGESYLAALDALHDAPVHTVVARHEGGAAMMAEAHGKITGRPGVAFVTRGPGATNASAGVHVAMQDSTPMVLFVGQVASDQRDREAFQEVDLRAMFAPLAKWAAEIDRTDRIPEYVARAFRVAASGRPGPVVLALPEDVLSAEAPGPREALPPVPPLRHEPSAAEIDAVRDALSEAERPLAIVGGGGWSGEATVALAKLATDWDLPIGTSFRCQDYFDNRHDCYAGDVGIGIDPALARRVAEADLLLVIGARLGEMTTGGYTLVRAPVPEQALIHVHADPDEIGRVYRPALGIAANPSSFVQALARLSPERPPQWSAWRAAARADRTEWIRPRETPGSVRLERVVAHLNDVLPAEAFVANGAGNYAAWMHRYFEYRGWSDGVRTQLAPTSGSMGYGLPAAIAAKLAHPAREAIALAGDGCFQMTMAEFGTACEQEANVVVLVCNNGVYGTIRMHQELRYPGRPSATGLANPDFAALARSYGAFGETVENDAEFPAALERARSAGRPALLDLRTDPAAVTPRTSAL